MGATQPGVLADYLVPVNADVGQLDVIFVPETDNRVNRLGIKGIGEIGIVGSMRDLPLALEQLL